ncbi:hypothetical protein R1sor_007270 [Riccia sorocarpa]|uniref:Major facilitator superfamily (MFS) profile domain-containing protein n=1 Tax=Riccia sorocarpa TaxID=122646 RepID=A0ABD3HWA0_9MARC
MAGGLVPVRGPVKQYEGRLTLYVAFACIVAASSGLIFGYDLGISGGVTSMDDFLSKFFPKVYRTEKSFQGKASNYCRYNNQLLQLFTSSLYLAGLCATFFAGYTTRNWGRRPTILIGGISFLAGAVFNGAAVNLAMLIIGRILLGVGVGFANQAAPLYISEMAPPKFRGGLNILFQSATTIGILTANIINYVAGKIHPWGWRLSLGLAAVPAFTLTFGGFFLPETPNSLIERGHFDQGRKVLEKIRGVHNVDLEYEDLLEASRISKTVQHPFRNLLLRKHRPQLIMAIFIPMFQQLTGNNAITFYAPVLFKSIGFGSNAALYSAVIVGSVKVIGTWISLVIVDRWGRKILFYEGGIQMILCQLAVGTIMQMELGLYNTLSKPLAIIVVILVCVYVAAFDWSWGPLAWLIPSEIYSLDIRSAAQSLTVAVNFAFTFLIGQIFLTLFCNIKWGTFFLFAGFLLFMTVFVALLLPETKGVPLEEMDYIWTKHWFWRRFVCEQTIGPKEVDPI